MGSAEWRARFKLSGLRPLLWPVVFIAAIVIIVRQATNAKDLADLLRAIATLAWPGVAILGMLWFKAEIRSLLSRIRKGKLFGNEVELDALELKVTEAEEKTQSDHRTEFRGKESFQVGARISQVDRTVNATAFAMPISGADTIDEVLKEASRSPSLGLMLLSSKLERAIQNLAVEAGIADIKQPNLRNLLRSLVQFELLPQEAGDALNIFSRIRNSVVHGHDANEEDVVRAIDSGIKLLRTVVAARQTFTIVRQVDIALFSDANAKLPVANARGIIIDLADGISRAIVPTHHSYQVGMRVTYNWDMDSKWADTWYRDPETHEIKKAWLESVEFIGMPVGRRKPQDG